MRVRQSRAFVAVAVCLGAALGAWKAAPAAPHVPAGAKPGDHADNQILVRLQPAAHQRAEHARKPRASKLEFDALPHLGAKVRNEARRWRAQRIRPLYTEEFARPDLAAKFGLDRMYIAEVPAGTDTRAMARAFDKHSDEIELAAVDVIGGVAETIPNDTYFSAQWGMRNTGQAIGSCSGGVNADRPCHNNSNCPGLCNGGSNHGNQWLSVCEIPRACSGGSNNGNPCTSAGDCPDGLCPGVSCSSGICSNVMVGFSDRDIDASDAWDIHTGIGGDIVVAVIDSGVLSTHTELAGRVLPGRNTYFNNSSTNDSCGHGTHVAGIIGASGNNALGVAGVNWGAKILPVRILGSPSTACGACGCGTLDSFVNGLIWAADQGADVANCSLQYYFHLTCSGGTRNGQACEVPQDCPGGGTCLGFAEKSQMQDAVDYAVSSGTLVVGATGNLPNGSTVPNASLEHSIGFPARNRRSIAIGGTTSTGARARLTNTSNPAWASKYGPQMDLMGPGDDIYSTSVSFNSPAYAFMSGTSMATPHVAGLASLIKSFAPTLAIEELMDTLIISADDFGPSGWDEEYGYGRINAHTALMAASAWPTVTNSIPTNYAIDAGQPGDPFGFETQGWLTFQMDLPPEEVAKISMASFTVLQKGGLALGVPQVGFIDVIDENTVSVTLDSPVRSLAWTTLRYERLGSITLGALPGDVDGSQVTNEQDLTALVAAFEAGNDPPLPLWSGDLDRSQRVTPLDILRCADLLNGADAFTRYTNVALP